jgi:hypothetical protein
MTGTSAFHPPFPLSAGFSAADISAGRGWLDAGTSASLPPRPASAGGGGRGWLDAGNNLSLYYYMEETWKA